MSEQRKPGFLYDPEDNVEVYPDDDRTVRLLVWSTPVNLSVEKARLVAKTINEAADIIEGESSE